MKLEHVLTLYAQKYPSKQIKYLNVILKSQNNWKKHKGTFMGGLSQPWCVPLMKHCRAATEGSSPSEHE